MEIQVSKLREALKLLEPAVPRKSNIESIKYVLLGNGKAVATDLEIAVSVALPEAVEPMLLPLKAALEFLDYAPGHRIANLTVQDNGVGVVVGDTEAHWVTKSAEDFPPIESRDFQHDAVLNGEVLVKAMVTVVDCAATEATRPVLNAVCLTNGENVEVVGADGFQLGWEKVVGKLPGEKPLIIPIHAVGLLERLWKKAAEPDLSGVETVAQLAMAKRLIRLEYNDSFLQLHFGRVAMLVKLIQGTYPSYQQLIPANFTSSVAVNAEDMTRALRQLGRIAAESSGIVRLAWEGANLKVSTKAAEVGMSSVTLAARCTSPGRIAFNQRYLGNYLAPLQGEVTISVTDSAGRGPALFSHHKSMRVVMPMFVEWDGNGKEQKVEVPAEPVETSDTSPDEPTDTTDGDSGDGLEVKKEEKTKKQRIRKSKVPVKAA